jgi:hypothetical protein
MKRKTTRSKLLAIAVTVLAINIAGSAEAKHDHGGDGWHGGDRHGDWGGHGGEAWHDGAGWHDNGRTMIGACSPGSDRSL